MTSHSVNVLYLTNMYPENPASYSGRFVKREIEELQKLGLHVDYLFVNGRERKLAYLDLFRIMGTLKKNFDVVNVQHSLLLPHVLFLRKILGLDIPVVFTLHEGELEKKGKEKNLMMYLFHSKVWRRPLFRRVDLIIAKNFAIYQNMGVSVTCVEIPTAVDVEKFKPMDQTSARNHLRLPHDALILFLPADRSRPEKNYSFLTGLVPQIKTEIQREVLLLSGPRPYEDMVWLYNAADVILLPSVYECSPVVIKEAMACNRPIVASDAGDIKKVIGATAGCHVLNGWDEREYLDAIIEASKHGSTEGRTVIFAHGYDWPTIGKKVSAALMTAIHKKNGQG